MASLGAHFTDLQLDASAVGNGTSLSVDQGGGAILVVTGTFVATIVPEVTIDGTNWFSVEAQGLSTGTKVTSITATGSFIVAAPGAVSIRARISAYTSGTVTVQGRKVVVALILPTGGSGSGGATEATLATRLSEADFDTKAGSLTEAAPATDTASSGLNGRLQRIAQRLTSLLALLPAALVGGRLDTNVGTWLGAATPTVGQKTMAASLPVAVASDQGNVPVSQATAANLNAQVVGAVANDVAISGNPIVVANAAATMADAAPGTRISADGRVVRGAADRDGTVYAHPHGPQVWSYHENSSAALTGATVHAAPGVGLSLYVTDIVCSTGAATAFNILFQEGVTTVLGPYYLEAVAGRGLAIHFQTPKKITANTALTVTTSAAIAHGLDVTGFIAPG